MLDFYGIDTEAKAPELADIQEAYSRIKGLVRHTPLLDQPAMDEVLGCKNYLKPEMLQYVGAFKLRGALNKILSLPEEEQKKGIITSSSGNHAQACSYAGRMLGIPVTVVIPEDAPEIKIRNAKHMGANVILWDRTYDARWQKVDEESKANGYVKVHPYEDPMVEAGQGTLALEILEDLPDVDTVLVPIGGGGLISGVATAIKQTNPNIRVVGVQALNSSPYYAARQAGKPVPVTGLPTVADGLSCRECGTRVYPIIEKYVDEIVAVEEDEILDAVRLVAEKAKLIAEPSSCVPIAAIQSGKVKVRPDEKVVSILTSGNWSLDMIGRIFKNEEVKGV